VIIYPAIDLRKGRCVRLQRGDVAAETVFADDPVVAARRWASEGAEWLHIVNLDGALGESFGGGVRCLEDVERLLGLGVARVILGTVAVREPQVVSEAIERYGPERVIVGIDARESYVAIHGWVDTSELTAIELGEQMRALGVKHVVYTDVQRDGMLSGVNVEETQRLARETGLSVIASGGVASMADILALKACEQDGIEGVIIGMALYRGAIQLSQALELARKGRGYAAQGRGYAAQGREYTAQGE